MFDLRTKFAQGVGVVAAMTAAGAASAGDLATAVTSGIDSAELMLIGVAVLTVSGVIFLIKSGKRTAT